MKTNIFRDSFYGFSGTARLKAVVTCFGEASHPDELFGSQAISPMFHLNAHSVVSPTSKVYRKIGISLLLALCHHFYCRPYASQTAVWSGVCMLIHIAHIAIQPIQDAYLLVMLMVPFD